MDTTSITRFILTSPNTTLVNDETKRHKLALMSWSVIAYFAAKFNDKELASLFFIKFAANEKITINAFLILPILIVIYQFLMYLYALHSSIKAYMANRFNLLLENKKNESDKTLDFNFNNITIDQSHIKSSIDKCSKIALELEECLKEQEKLVCYSPPQSFSEIDIPTYQRELINSTLKEISKLPPLVHDIANGHSKDIIEKYRKIEEIANLLKGNLKSTVQPELEVQIRTLDVLNSFQKYHTHLLEQHKILSLLTKQIDGIHNHNTENMERLNLIIKKIFKDEKLIVNPESSRLLFNSLERSDFIIYLLLPSIISLGAAGYCLLKWL